MSNTPKPLSDDWLNWNPETIHEYPAEASEPTPPSLDGPLEVSSPTGHSTTSRVGAGLWKDVALSVATGLAAAIILTAVILLFPNASRADDLRAEVPSYPYGHVDSQAQPR